MKNESGDYKVLEEFPDYRIYKDGRVYSALSSKFISKSSRGGYYYVSLVRVNNGDRKRVTRGLHWLVATSFIPNPEILPIPNHLDGDGHNNCIDNLEWCTHKQNSQHAHDTGLHPQKGRPVLQYTLDGKFIRRYEKARDAAKAVSCCHQAITHACAGRKKTIKGFIWKFETEKEICSEDEDYKIIKGYESYKISNMGRIFSLKTNRYLSLTTRKDGYQRVHLNQESKYVHVLVATAFHGSPPDHLKRPVVDHINNDKQDNRIENLEWIEFNENIRRACKTGALDNCLSVIRYDLEGNEMKRYRSVAKAAKDVGTSHTSILNACHKKKHCHTIVDCLWRFENDPLKPDEAKTITRSKTNVVQYSLNGEKLKEYKSMAEASRETGTPRASISHVCRGKIKTAGGFVWRYASDSHPIGKTSTTIKKVRQLSLDGEEIKVWNKISDAAKELGIQGSHITGVCKGKRKTTGGYKWEYANH